MTEQTEVTGQAENSEQRAGLLQRLFPHQRMEYLAHVAHIVNAVAVSATLLFVGLELHHSSAVAERGNHDATFQQALEIQLAIGVHRDVAELMIKGEGGAVALDPADQLRFDRLLTALMRGFQQVWEREQLGAYPEGSFFREVAPGFAAHLNSPGGNAWWQRRKGAFPHGYALDVDKALALAAPAPAR